MKLHSLNMTPEVVALISELDAFCASWNDVHTLAPERLAVLKHVATIESIGSSTRIEGVKLSDVEIETLLGNIKTTSFQTRDQKEVVGYAETIETIFEHFQEIHFSENYIFQLHSMLLRHSEKDARHRGQYKKLHNHVEAFDPNGKSLGIIFQTASPFDTPQRMRDLVYWTQDHLRDGVFHPLIIIAVFNVMFLAIHPFQDGNGRLSRILVTLLLLKTDYNYIPFSSLESVVEANKEGYYRALRRTQATMNEDDPDWLPWIIFFLRTLKKQMTHLKIKLSENDGLLSLPSESVHILEYLGAYKRITIKEAIALTGVPRATLKTRLNALIDGGYIERHGKARGTWYSKKG